MYIVIGRFITIMNKYLIATEYGGLVEMPEFTYERFKIISSTSMDMALEKYNKRYKCDYFYGTCVAEKINGVLKVLNKEAYSFSTVNF